MVLSSHHVSASPPCGNLNHVRLNPPVRHCPNCGAIVNDTIPVARCSEHEHADRRRHRDAYCIGCGAQLIAL